MGHWLPAESAKTGWNAKVSNAFPLMFFSVKRGAEGLARHMGVAVHVGKYRAAQHADPQPTSDKHVCPVISLKKTSTWRQLILYCTLRYLFLLSMLWSVILWSSQIHGQNKRKVRIYPQQCSSEVCAAHVFGEYKQKRLHGLCWGFVCKGLCFFIFFFSTFSSCFSFHPIARLGFMYFTWTV